ncbi:hypothetical protein Tco_1018121 [Tanacetum coccineum]|uniref:Uncharacterized protein n=1 Tax=Tanacetum coccineum TaxID=301880 RepID=A0ABQ5FTE7_9ASTR
MAITYAIFEGENSESNVINTIGKGNLLLDLQKLQMNPIFRILVDISNVPSIYIQLFWNTLTHDAKSRVYSFQVDEHWLTLSADLLRKALNVTPADSAHPFESPSAGKTDITFTRRRVPSNWLMKMKFNRLLNLIWMIMSTIYNKRWIIASQDETIGPFCNILRMLQFHKGMVLKLYLIAEAEVWWWFKLLNKSCGSLAGPNPTHADVIPCYKLTLRRNHSGPEPFMKTLDNSMHGSPHPHIVNQYLWLLLLTRNCFYLQYIFSTRWLKDAPYYKSFTVSLQVHPPVFPQGVTAGPTIEDTSITQADLHPSLSLLRRTGNHNPDYVMVNGSSEFTKSSLMSMVMFLKDKARYSKGYRQVGEKSLSVKPEGFEDQDNPYARLSLKKALYGLKSGTKERRNLEMDRTDPVKHHGGVDETGRGSRMGFQLRPNSIVRGMVGSLMYLTPSRPDLMRIIAGCPDVEKKYFGKCSVSGDSWSAGHQRSNRSTAIQTTRANTIAMSGMLDQIFDEISAKRLRLSFIRIPLYK